MAPQIWNPEEMLHVDARAKHMFCIGAAGPGGNALCRRRITAIRHSRICSILDTMGKKPPTEISGSKLLSQLAELSLCDEQHWRQKSLILEWWEGVIEDVAEQYEEMERLKRRNSLLKTKLFEEREEREELQRLLTENSVDCVESQEESDARESDLLLQVKELEHSLADARESDLLLQVKELEHSLAESRGQAERQAVQEAELSRQLAEERRNAALTFETTAKQIDELQSQLCTHDRVSKLLRTQLEKANKDRAFLEEGYKALFETESQSLNQVRRNLDEARVSHTTLLKEKDNIKSLLAAECQTSGQLQKSLESLEIELASVQEILNHTQLELTQRSKVNEEQVGANAACRAATAAATAQLLDRIRQLEGQSWFSFLSTFVSRVKGLAEHVPLWGTGGRWPWRGNGTQAGIVLIRVFSFFRRHESRR